MWSVLRRQMLQFHRLWGNMLVNPITRGKSETDSAPNVQRDVAKQLIDKLKRLRDRMFAGEAGWSTSIAQVHPNRRASAINLAHYLALRQTDIRDLQPRLASLGLSRLGRSEAHTLSSLNAVLTALYALTGRRVPVFTEGPVNISEGTSLIARYARELLGPTSLNRQARIMVTMPSEAAHQPELLRELLMAGMNVMRINCAHDGADAWLAMINNLRMAEQVTGRKCRVYADLAGPKLRTGDLMPVGRALELKPGRDVWGHVIRPATVWVTPAVKPEPPPNGVNAVVPITDHVLATASVRDRLALDDSRGGQREITLTKRIGQSWLAEGLRHIYLRDGAGCALHRSNGEPVLGHVGPLPEIVLPLILRNGDKLLLTPEEQLGGPAQLDAEGITLKYASIPCTLDAAFAAARPGQPIWFNDGKIGGVILSVEPSRILVEITQAPLRGGRLRPEKGINLPDTILDVPALSDKDLSDLKVLAPHVDLVGLSFVRTAEDIEALHDALFDLDAQHLGTVLKIETRRGFENLPQILMAGLAHPPFGIMVARGDLAVEIGFERLAEVQEEILWLCEAAHVPVIWATQVLESMTKQGLPSRAEVSDAAFGVRSECVMLNKGSYIVETVRFLSGVLGRMDTHHAKRRPMMRRLAVADRKAKPLPRLADAASSNVT
jgi:pyruvate kinase